jgi:hypothetical protein
LINERIKYKSLLKKRSRREFENDEAIVVNTIGNSKEKIMQVDITQENELANGKWIDTDHVVKKIDYDNLE